MTEDRILVQSLFSFFRTGKDKKSLVLRETVSHRPPVLRPLSSVLYFRNAFTLAEVLIALLLMSVVLMIVGMAIDTHLRLLDVSRTEVEESQLGRAVLEKIARDIRSVVIAQPKENLEIDTSIFTSAFGDVGALMEMSGTDGTTAEDSNWDEVPESAIGTMPGIYGSLEWIQIDSGRLPRGETYKTDWVLGEGNALGDRVSPTKTTLYYLGKDTGRLSEDESRPERTVGSLGLAFDRFTVQYGLFRRQLDRNVTEYAVDEGKEEEYERYDEPLAPEVEGVEFYYYDSENEEWLDYWDMDEIGSLPGAVRAVVRIRRQAPLRSAFWLGRQDKPIDTITYSLVIPMPLSYTAPVAAEEEDASAAE